ncbi:hypothetical protein D3C75_744040 [compost metagenome]
MAEHASACGELGVAGDFLLTNLKVIAPAQFGVHPHGLQVVDDRLGEFQEIMKRLPVVFGNEAEVKVAQIVIDRPAAG